MPTAGQKAQAVKASGKTTKKAAKKAAPKMPMMSGMAYDEAALAENKKGMGFKSAQKSIAAKQGISMDRAGAILQAGRANASKKAVAANPNLKKVPTKGSSKSKGGNFK